MSTSALLVSERFSESAQITSAEDLKSVHVNNKPHNSTNINKREYNSQKQRSVLQERIRTRNFWK